MPVAAQQAAISDKHEPVAATNLEPQTPTADAGTQAIVELPDSPGATLAKAADPVQSQNTSAPQSASATSSAWQAQPQSSSTQAPPVPQKPVGTAAAEAPNVTGVAASQPAGVAIAPAKQRRVRTIVLRVGAIVGAGVAVGSVIALTAATPSKPPGAH